MLGKTRPVKRRGWGISYPGLCNILGPTIAQKYKIHQNAPFLKEKFKKIFPRGRMFPWVSLWFLMGLSKSQCSTSLQAAAKHIISFDVKDTHRICW